jgi:hypothetical protein
VGIGLTLTTTQKNNGPFLEEDNTPTSVVIFAHNVKRSVENDQVARTQDPKYKQQERQRHLENEVTVCSRQCRRGEHHQGIGSYRKRAMEVLGN